MLAEEKDMSRNITECKIDDMVVKKINPLLSLQYQYKAGQSVFRETEKRPKDATIRGLYWTDYEHWTACTLRCLTTPLTESMIPVTSSFLMDSFVEILRFHMLHKTYETMTVGKAIPDIVSHMPSLFPPLSSLLNEPNMLNRLYECVAKNVFFALMTYPDVRRAQCQTHQDQEVYQTGYEDTFSVILGRNSYSVNAYMGDPFSPWNNDFVRRRWQLEQYCRARRLIIAEDRKEPDSLQDPVRKDDEQWTKFVVRNVFISGVQHASGLSYGDVSVDAGPFIALQTQIQAILNMGMVSGDLVPKYRPALMDMFNRVLSKDTPTICYLNVVRGDLHITHPMFPRGTCLSFQLPINLTSKEFEIMMVVMKGATSLTEYVVAMEGPLRQNVAC